MLPEPDERISTGPEEGTRWWPLSAKTQIVLIAVAIGLFNCFLLAIFAAVFFLHFG